MQVLEPEQMRYNHSIFPSLNMLMPLSQKDSDLPIVNLTEHMNLTKV